MWEQLAAAGIGALGSALGGGQKTYVPRSGTKNSERNRLNALNYMLYGGGTKPGAGVNKQAGTGSGGAEALFTNPDNYMTYGPQPFSDPNAYELGAISGLGSYATDFFPGAFNTYAGALTGGLGGDPTLNQYSQQMANLLPTLTGALGQPPQVTNPGFDPSQYTGLIQGAMGADPTDAINRMLSGDLDLNLFQGAIDQYLQPAMEQFNEQLLPSFLRADAAATGGQSSAGALKAAQRTQEQIGEGLGAYLGGRLYDASQSAANRMGVGVQGALNQYGQNLQGLGLAGNFAGQNSQFDLNSQLANQGAYSDWTRNMLSGVGLGAGAATDSASLATRYASLFPGMMQAGMLGPEALGMAGQGLRGLMDPYARYNFDSHMFNQQQPYNMANSWFNMLNGVSIPGLGAAPIQSGGSPLISGLASLMGNWPTAGTGIGSNSSGVDLSGFQTTEQALQGLWG